MAKAKKQTHKEKLHSELLALVPKSKAKSATGGFDWSTLIQILLALWEKLNKPKPPVPPVDPPTPPKCPPGTHLVTYGTSPVTYGCVPDVPPPIEPPPVDPPPPDPKCVRPDGIKLGWRDQRKIQPGWRNTFNVTPTIGGVPAPEGCGQFYFDTYGQPEAYQSLEGGFQKDDVERASGDSFGCILVLATNSEELWKDGRYTEAGKMTIAVSYPWLKFWRAQDCVMGEDGKITGAGNNTKSYDIPK